eukprot:140905_1
MTDSDIEANYDLFRVGQLVLVIGLSAEKYNGKVAKIRGPYLADTSRWPVQICDNHIQQKMSCEWRDANNEEKLAIKSVNLRRLMPLGYKPSYSSGVYGSYCVETLEKKEDDRERFPVQVFVRMRPLVGKEITEKHVSVEYSVKNLKKKKQQSLTLKKVHGRNNERDKKYSNFKAVFEPNVNNEETFNNSLLTTCVPYIFNGESACVFAYGHTGSGKTHTIFGYKDEAGMYQLFAERLLSDKRLQSDAFIEMRFTELYQGKIRDLLSKDGAECFVRESDAGEIHIRAQPKKCDDGKIRQYPITAVHVQKVEDLLKVVAEGIGSRNVGNSTLHDKSSRSHAFLEMELVTSELIEERKKIIEVEADILQLQLIIDSPSLKVLTSKYAKKKQPIPESLLKKAELVDGLRNGRKLHELQEELTTRQKEKERIENIVFNLCNDGDKPHIGGTVVFVDLAGNEYGRDVKNKDAQEERERNEINKSLLALKECIRGLHNNKQHIGYRNSKLTMYLRKYLGGKDSKAIMISNIGSSQTYAKQTINTLQYSQLVAKA